MIKEMKKELDKLSTVNVSNEGSISEKLLVLETWKRNLTMFSFIKKYRLKKTIIKVCKEYENTNHEEKIKKNKTNEEK